MQDKPGMLGKLITAIGQTQAHLGDIKTVGIESHSKIRGIQVYCSSKEHLSQLLEQVETLDGIEVFSVKDDVLEIHRRGDIEIKSRVPIKSVADL